MDEKNTDDSQKNPNIRDRVIDDELKEAYINYAMSVIVGRALPDVRDGLKPVHRRILYSMHELGLAHNKAYKKSARIVGETLGKYHPHGDVAVYDSLARMSQEFSLRYVLIDGQGNFGSIDGDSPAAMRYTEARLSKIAEEMLFDIDKETVQFIPNFDGSLKEPALLPSKIPNLLINGSSGIAVGMATNIPPHNIKEVAEAVKFVITKRIDNHEYSLNDILPLIKGPDFPTGGVLVGKERINLLYKTGRGSIIIRSKYHFEEKKGKELIIIDEIPYQVNKSMLLENIADLVRNKIIEGISNIKDESNKEGIRVLIELKKGYEKEIILNQLLKQTNLQVTFGGILLALDNGIPKIFSLVEILERYVDFRRDIITKRLKFDLKKAEEKHHVLEGIKIAIDNIDSVVEKIKKSKNVQDAKEMLSRDYKLTEIQAEAILEMKLQRLTSMESEKVVLELNRLKEEILKLKEILGDIVKIYKIIIVEMEELIKNYGDKRRTDIEETEERIEDEDLMENDEFMVTLTSKGYIKRTKLEEYRVQKRSGKGIIATNTEENDFVIQNTFSSTKDYLLLFSNMGRIYYLKTYDLPEGTRYAKGRAIVNILNLKEGEKITSLSSLKQFEDRFLTFVTKLGTIKRTKLELFAKPRNGGLQAINLHENDELIGVAITTGYDEFIITTSDGYAIRFKEEDVRDMGRAASGVRGIKLRDGKVVAFDVAKENQQILTITKNGYGKRSDVSEYRLINRGGKGVTNINITEKNGDVIKSFVVNGGEQLLIITKKGVSIRINMNEVSVIGRNTQGVRLIKLDEGDEIVSAGIIEEKEESENNSEK